MGTTALLPNPYGLHMPCPKVGQEVKLMLSDGMFTERVWAKVKLVKLEAGLPTILLATVRSTSYYLDGPSYGEHLFFEPRHIHEITGWRV